MKPSTTKASIRKDAAGGDGADPGRGNGDAGAGRHSRHVDRTCQAAAGWPDVSFILQFKNAAPVTVQVKVRGLAGKPDAGMGNMKM